MLHNNPWQLFIASCRMQPLLGLTDLIQKAHHHFYQGAQFFFPFDQRNLPKIAARSIGQQEGGCQSPLVAKRRFSKAPNASPRFPGTSGRSQILDALSANAQRSREL